MFTEEDFCSYGTSMCLKYAGYVDACRYSYIKNTRVSDEIMEKHPGLSDYGYMDLIKTYGGTYDRKDVYKTYIEIAEEYHKNSFIDAPPYIKCTAPTLQEAIDWICKTFNIWITAKPYVCEDGIRWLSEIRKIHIDKVELVKTITCKVSYHDAINDAITYTLTEEKNLYIYNIESERNG